MFCDFNGYPPYVLKFEFRILCIRLKRRIFVRDVCFGTRQLVHSWAAPPTLSAESPNGPFMGTRPIVSTSNTPYYRKKPNCTHHFVHVVHRIL